MHLPLLLRCMEAYSDTHVYFEDKALDKSILVEYIDAKKLLEETEADLYRLKNRQGRIAVDSVKGSNPNFPYEPRTFHIEGVEYGEYKKSDEIRRLEKILTERRERAKGIRIEVEAWINTIPPRIQRIVRMRYMKGLTWDRISAELGYLSNSAARMELKRFLDNEDSKCN